MTNGETPIDLGPYHPGVADLVSAQESELLRRVLARWSRPIAFHEYLGAYRDAVTEKAFACGCGPGRNG